jgi:long-chain acyl-CoA synthetase
MLLHQILLSARPAERSALIANDTPLSYGDLTACVLALAQRVIETGVTHSARIGVCTSRKRDFVVGMLAAWAAGATVVPVPDDDAAHSREIVETLDLSAVLGPANALQRMSGIAGALRTFSTSDEAAAGVEQQIAFANLPLDAIAVMLHSSGTTSARRKSIEIPVQTLLSVIGNLNEAVAVPDAVVEYLMSPPQHAFGFARICAVLCKAGTMVLDDGLFNPLKTLAGIRKYNCQSLTGVASGIVLLLEKLPAQFADYGRELRWMEFGSVPMSVASKQKLLELFPLAHLVMEYGLTEAMRSVFVDYRRHPDKIESVGRPVGDVEVAVLDSAGQVLSAGEEGELAVRGKNVAQGYWRNRELWDSRKANGWLRTGDFGRLDRDGYVYFAGRKDDLINSGGNKISPQEVEDLLIELLPGKQFAVIGRPDPVLGEVPVLCIEGPGDADTSALKAAIAAQLPLWKQPRDIRFIDRLPRTSNGKLLRRQIREAMDAA